MADNLVISEYAPVIIPTLSRYEHLERCIDSLRKNSYAAYTDLYIGVDYPPSAKYEEGYKKICDYLDAGIDGFKNVYIFKQEKNLGAIGNSGYLTDRVSEKHSRWIYTEDDNEFSESFLEYMNRVLEKYSDVPGAYSITGYNYPVDCKDWDGNVYINSAYCACYGIGTFRQKYYDMLDKVTIPWLKGLYHNLRYMRRLRRLAPNQYCNFVKSYLGYKSIPLIRDGKVQKIDIVFGLYTFAEGMYNVFPTVSRVKNWGFDGSGENCDVLPVDAEQKKNHRNYDFTKQPIDDSSEFGEVKVCSKSQEEILEAVDGFFEIPKKELYRTDLAYIFSRLIGVEITKKLLAR